MPVPMEAYERQDPEEGSLSERAAATRRLMGSYQANLEAVAAHMREESAKLEAQKSQVYEQIKTLEAKTYLDDNDRRKYAMLSKKAAELDELQAAADEMFDRADMVIPYDNSDSNKPSSNVQA